MPGAALPREMSVPFAIDAAGQIAFETDPIQRLINRVKVVVGTQMNERVMLPGYGVALNTYVFSVNDEFTMQQLQNDIQQAITVWEPSVEVVSIEPTQNPDNGELGIRVFFSSAEMSDVTPPPVYSAFITTGGTVMSR